MIYKRGRTWWYRFQFGGRLIRESTHQSNDNIARQEEATHRSRLTSEQQARKAARQKLGTSNVTQCDECTKWQSDDLIINEGGKSFCSDGCRRTWGLRHVKVPSLADFLEKQFLVHTETRFAAKPASHAYYAYGASLLKPSALGAMPLDRINTQHVSGFIATHGQLAVATQNAALKTLRRALNLAVEWGVIDRAPKLKLVAGENRRDRVVTEPEFLAYRELCRQPWRDCVTVLYGTAIRPGEAFALDWSNVVIGEDRGLLRIVEGKTRSARRTLPLLPEVLNTLRTRWIEQKRPKSGFVFPAASKDGRIHQDGTKRAHNDALAQLSNATEASKRWEKDHDGQRWEQFVSEATGLEADYLLRHRKVVEDGVEDFCPYVLRHSALTRLAEFCDPYTLAKIAGHSSITITMRYCHPQAEAVESAFDRLNEQKLLPAHKGGHKTGHKPKRRDSGSNKRTSARA